MLSSVGFVFLYRQLNRNTAPVIASIGRSSSWSRIAYRHRFIKYHETTQYNTSTSCVGRITLSGLLNHSHYVVQRSPWSVALYQEKKKIKNLTVEIQPFFKTVNRSRYEFSRQFSCKSRCRFFVNHARNVTIIHFFQTIFRQTSVRLVVFAQIIIVEIASRQMCNGLCKVKLNKYRCLSLF